MEEAARRWMDLTLMVPDILLHVATSKEILIIIDKIYLLQNCGSEFEDLGDVRSALDTSSGGGRAFGAPSYTACGGEYSFGACSDTTMTTDGVDGGYCFAVPFNRRTFQVPLNITGGGEHIDGDDDMEIILDATAGGEQLIEDDNMEIIQDDTTGGGEGTDDLFNHYVFQLWSESITRYFTAAHREITRLLSLHGEVGHVFSLCAALLGLTNDGEPWQRWREHRATAVARAHDALLSLASAASAAAAALDLLIIPEYSLQNEWAPESLMLLLGARRDVDEARDAVKLMRDAVAREFFETWMILKRA